MHFMYTIISTSLSKLFSYRIKYTTKNPSDLRPKLLTAILPTSSAEKIAVTSNIAASLP